MPIRCHLQMCLQGSILAASKDSAVTGRKSKHRDAPYVPSISTLFNFTSCFSSLSLLEAMCFPTHFLFGLQEPLTKNTQEASLYLTYPEYRCWLGLA